MEEDHPLQYPWTFTYFKKVANRGYEDSTFNMGTVKTVRRRRDGQQLLQPRLASP